MATDLHLALATARARETRAAVRHYECQTRGSFCPERIRKEASDELQAARLEVDRCEEELHLAEAFALLGVDGLLDETTALPLAA